MLEVSVEQFMHRRLDRAVASCSAIADRAGALRRDFLFAATQAFSEVRGDPARALACLTGHVDALMTEYVARGGTVGDLHALFDRAQQEATAALHAAQRLGMYDPAPAVPPRLRAFIDQLRSYAVAALEREIFRRDLDPSSARHLLRRALFYRPPNSYLTDVLEKATGLEPGAEVVVVVAVRGELPDAWHASSQVLWGLSTNEALCPVDMLPSPGDLPDGTRVVVGPPVAWTEATTSLIDARKLATMLLHGEVVDDRSVVFTADWVVEVCLRASDGDADTLIKRHLAPLARLSPKRRLTLVETLVRRLESSLPANQLAEAMGVPTQTMHSRLARLRELIGDRWLADDRLHHELTIAARAAVRRWAASA